MPPQPLRRIGLANCITGIRAILIASLVLGPWRGWDLVAAGILALALDGIDGRVARSRGEASAFGARFDMEVDAAFMLGLSALVAAEGRAGAWVLLAGLLRYLWGAAGWVWPILTRPLAPSRLRQAGCVAALALLLAALAPPFEGWPAILAAAGAVGVLLASFGRDLRALLLSRGMDLGGGSDYLSSDPTQEVP